MRIFILLILLLKEGYLGASHDTELLEAILIGEFSTDGQPGERSEPDVLAVAVMNCAEGIMTVSELFLTASLNCTAVSSCNCTGRSCAADFNPTMHNDRIKSVFKCLIVLLFWLSIIS